MFNYLTRLCTLAGATALLAGCSSQPTPPAPPELNSVVAAIDENPVPGTVNGAWVEPMYDTVRVPGQLDPKGTYYRMPHNTVVEIRRGKFQRVEFPKDGEVQQGGQ